MGRLPSSRTQLLNPKDKAIAQEANALRILSSSNETPTAKVECREPWNASTNLAHVSIAKILILFYVNIILRVNSWNNTGPAGYQNNQNVKLPDFQTKHKGIQFRVDRTTLHAAYCWTVDRMHERWNKAVQGHHKHNKMGRSTLQIHGKVLFH